MDEQAHAKQMQYGSALGQLNARGDGKAHSLAPTKI